MDSKAVETVIRYHDATKHHPRRYARSLGYLDWANQPDPFRRFEGAALSLLEIPDGSGSPAFDELFAAGAVTPAALSFRSVSRFFYLSLAISAWKRAGGSTWALRCNPSSGNLHPTEGYAVLPGLAGLGERAGVYHYAPREHGLERRATLSPEAWTALTGRFPAGSFLVGLSSVLWREAWKYGERAFRYCQHDVGHALGGLRMAAAEQGWVVAVLEELSDAEVAGVLGLDRAADFADAEPEHPDLLAVVSPGGAGRPVPLSLSAEAVQLAARSEWHGEANRLSAEHAEWEIIDEVAEATRKRERSTAPAFDAQGVNDRPPVASARRVGLSAFEVIRRRRSGVAFDGKTSITAATFYHMMARVLPCGGRAAGAAAPWDALTTPAWIDLLLFVHRVEGLEPGVYVLVRDAARAEPLRAAMAGDFAWARPAGCPAGVPLYLLDAGDCRRLAAHLSLGQEIAGESAFSLGMIAAFERGLRERGAWFYRRLFWEAGLVGQVLYLESEAAGVRSTGIGAYFDDLVHELAGLRGPAHQSLYHFTVGGAVEDGRIATLPSYERAAAEAEGRSASAPQAR